MTHFTAPVQPLTDGVVTLRLPSVDAGDVNAVISYTEQKQLDGGWLPEIPLVTAEQAVADWLDAWAGRPGRNGSRGGLILPRPVKAAFPHPLAVYSGSLSPSL